MKKVELHQDIRIKRDENYQVLKTIEDRISAKIRAEFESEVSAIRAENDTFHKKDNEFREEARELLKTITPQTLLKVRTQVGIGSKVIQEYEGHIEKNIKYNDGTFNFISPDIHDGKPFTIGFSCLQSIEIIDEEEVDNDFPKYGKDLAPYNLPDND